MLEYLVHLFRGEFDDMWADDGVRRFVHVREAQRLLAAGDANKAVLGWMTGGPYDVGSGDKVLGPRRGGSHLWTTVQQETSYSAVGYGDYQ